MPKSDGDNFYLVLKNFYDEVKHEWAGQEKKIEDFEKDGPKIVIVLDNASFHKKKEIIERIEAVSLTRFQEETTMGWSINFAILLMANHS
ncbi:MAG: hypothetical protein GDA56_09635 [Hormoscilla sp. GM7CHS1pb]|nr:hypothetical protein [Hormoscilla sp. GM7CHS1pb]